MSSDAASSDNAVAAIAPASAEAAEESASSFAAAASAPEPAPAKPRPTSYRPFHPTSTWQLVEDDHILPPGLAIKFDFDSDKKYARRQPQPGSDKQTEEQEAQEIKKADEAASTNGTAPSEAAEAAAPDTKAAANASASAPAPKTPAASHPTQQKGKGGKAPKGSRGMSTSAAPSAGRAVVSSKGRPIVLPVFPEPSSDFLAARSLLPAERPSPSRPVISVAPMVDVTDRHFRYMMRLISKHALLYTPMIVDNALARAPHAHAMYTQHLAVEHPPKHCR